MNTQRRAKLLVIAFALIAVWATATAAVPETIGFQGTLARNGALVPDSSFTVTFSLYADTTQPAIWTETKAVTTADGLFNTQLGSTVPLTLPFDNPYWIGVQLQGESEMQPRLPLNSVPYALNTKSSGGWTISGNNVISTGSGNIGIGTLDPQAKLDVAGTISTSELRVTGSSKLSFVGGNHTLEIGPETIASGQPSFIDFHTGIGASRNEDFNMRIVNYEDHALHIEEPGNPGYLRRLSVRNGNIGIGIDNPAFKLDVAGQIHTSDVVTAGPYGTTMAHASLELGGPSGFTPFIDFHNGDATGEDFDTRLIATGPDELSVHGGNLRVPATTVTNILQITGGADLAEPFVMPELLPVGAVVVIDESNPGHLRLSSDTYDRKVAGIISGAGGITPGLTLQQDGMFETGQNVALTGRVYALCDADSNPIQPGDLLTTSERPGHAMKATDNSRSHGAIIGKAMSTLESGQGLVLVLVNLQ